MTQKQTNIYARNTGHLGSYRRFKPKGVVSNTGTTFFNGKETVINLSGQLDTLTSVDLEKEIAPILQGETQTVVLDGAELTYISSAGLRLLLTLQKGMKNKGGSFRLKNIQNEIMEILNITGFSHILTIE